MLQDIVSFYGPKHILNFHNNIFYTPKNHHVYSVETWYRFFYSLNCSVSVVSIRMLSGQTFGGPHLLLILTFHG